jgi:mannose-6-phosphate isomerase-like protein (cupin superfamily)
MVNTAPITDLDFTEAEMEAHVARFADIPSTAKSFIDTRLPGHERDIYTIIGGGVLEDPDIRPPIAPQEFHLAIIRADPGKGAALHSHLTQEVFMPLSGRWAICWGPAGGREVILEQYDTISVPVHVMRGFRNVGTESAMMLAIVGGHDPGRVGWPEAMKAMVRNIGYELTVDGTLREIPPARP